MNLFGEDYVRDIDVAPEGVASRLRGAINLKPKRVLGLLKVSSEFIGVVAEGEFAVWERSGHATQARGLIRPRRGGTRVEARIGLRQRTLVLGAVFFALFALIAYQLITSAEAPGGPAAVVFAVVAAAFTAWLFWSASLRQRAALRRFLDEVFATR